MIEREGISIGTSAAEGAFAEQNRVLDLPPMSSETWELIKFQLMGELNARLWTMIGRAIAVVAVLISLVTSAGYFGIPAYIQSIFKEKIEQETKTFDKLHEEISRQQAGIYENQKIFIALLEKYVREQQTMFDLASRSVEEINKSETLNSTNMLEFKKSLLDGIKQMINITMMWDAYKTLRRELNRKLDALNQTDFRAVNELFAIYPHISALNYTLRRSIDGLVVKENADQETKAILFKEYEASVYPIYREAFDKFGTGMFSAADQTWSTLQPGADMLFLTLNPWTNKWIEWSEKQNSR
jgi:hypothetical protein